MEKVMKKLGVFAIFILFLVMAAACGNGNSSAEDSGIHGALHRIEVGDNVVYLFGSMHVAAPEWFPLAGVVEEAMERADVFAFEFDMRPGFEEEMGTFFMDEAVLPNGQRLVDILPAEVYANFLEVLPSYGAVYEYLNHLNPVAIRMNLESSIMLWHYIEQGLTFEGGVDGYILNFAMDQELPIIGLEPLEQQLQIAFAPNNELLERAQFPFTAEEVMEEVLVGFMSPDELMESAGGEIYLHELYLNNELEEINDLFQVDPEFYENAFGRYFYEVLMNFRSTYYANEIARLLEETPESTTFFVTVGLSHIMRSGDHLTNIVEQLALQGIIAEPIFE